MHRFRGIVAGAASLCGLGGYALCECDEIGGTLIQQLESIRDRITAITKKVRSPSTPAVSAAPRTTTFDYIVVGAGSSGCAVACRLAERLPHARTLLLEAGTHDDIESIQTSVDYFGKVESVFGSERDWMFHSEAQPELAGRSLYWPRGKTLGGCSSFNTMVYLRADPKDYDVRWRDALGEGFEDWGWDARRRSSAEHLIATKARRCTAMAWNLIVAQ